MDTYLGQSAHQAFAASTQELKYLCTSWRSKFTTPKYKLLPEEEDSYLQDLMEELNLELALEELDKYCLCFKEKCWSLLQTCWEACLDILGHPLEMGTLPHQSPSSDLTFVLDYFESALLQVGRRGPLYLESLPEQKAKLEERRKQASEALYYKLSYPPPQISVPYPPAPQERTAQALGIWDPLTLKAKGLLKSLKSRLPYSSKGTSNSLLEDSLGDLEHHCICYEKNCQKLLEHSLLKVESLLRTYGQELKFQNTEIPAMDFAQALSNNTEALELVINQEGRVSERLGKLGARLGKLRFKHRAGPSVFQHFWKQNRTQDLQVFNVHFIKNNLG